MKKLTNDEFIKRAILIHGNEYDYSLVDYCNSKIKVIIVCLKHGKFLQKPNDHLTGYGCKKCQYEKTSKENKFTNKSFIEKSKQVHGNKFNYDLVEYVDYESKVKIVCNKHGIFEQTPHNHLSGCGCRKCRASKNEEKISMFLLKHNIKFNREVTFNDLKDKSNLFYDFYLPEHKLFIEFDGIQHYKPIEFFGGKTALIENRRRDLIKINYAINNGYWLTKIPHSILGSVEEALECELKNLSIL